MFMPLAPAATVLDRFPAALATVLRAHGVPDPVAGCVVAETRDTRLATTNDRSVLGVMNEFVRLADWRRDEVHDTGGLVWLSLELARVPCSPLYQRHVSPDRELAAALGV